MHLHILCCSPPRLDIASKVEGGPSIPSMSPHGTDRQFAAVQRFRQQFEGTADEEWTQLKRRS